MVCHVFPKCDCVAFCKYGPTLAAQGSGAPKPSLKRYQGKPCAYCHIPMDYGHPRLSPTRDHIVPRSRGGENGTHNYVRACRRCNEDKRNMFLDEWYERLVRDNDPRAAIVGRYVTCHG